MHNRMQSSPNSWLGYLEIQGTSRGIAWLKQSTMDRTTFYPSGICMDSQNSALRHLLNTPFPSSAGEEETFSH